MSESEWPKDVRRQAALVREAGFSPEVTGHPGGRWAVTVSGEHVRAVAFYDFQNGRTQYAGGELTIDGEPHPVAHGMEELRRIWDEHEQGIVPALPSLISIEDPGNREMPAPVKAIIDAVQRRDSTLSVRAGMFGDCWVVGLDLPDGGGLRAIFRRRGWGWYLDRASPLQLIIGGKDRTDEAGGSLEKALEILGTRDSAPAPAVPAVRKQRKTRDQGVETRRMVVIRELFQFAGDGLGLAGECFPEVLFQPCPDPLHCLILGDFLLAAGQVTGFQLAG